MLARGASGVIEDRRFAAELRGKLRADMERGARVVAKTRWFRQPLWKRIPNWIAYGLTRFTMGLFGFRGAAFTPPLFPANPRPPQGPARPPRPHSGADPRPPPCHTSPPPR